LYFKAHLPEKAFTSGHITLDNSNSNAKYFSKNGKSKNIPFIYLYQHNITCNMAILLIFPSRIADMIFGRFNFPVVPHSFSNKKKLSKRELILILIIK